ncbi:hypothetical protein RIF29_38174 [Crotalaria pallida]|uniref:OTU domain-containing protein n=1 Tax=Crotalaria pallida TaxID=3830 RepID=A0AAN9DYP5_CROPI
MRQVDAVDPLLIRRYIFRWHEIVYLRTTSKIPPKDKVNTKGAKKGRQKQVAHEKSTLCDPSHWVFGEFDEIFQGKGSSPHTSQPKGLKRKHTQTNPSQVRASQSWERYLEAFPIDLHSYIHRIVNVESDGHCGFRSLSLQKYGIEENYYIVRHEHIMEIGANKELYISIMGYDCYGVTKRALHALIGSIPQRKLVRTS